MAAAGNVGVELLKYSTWIGGGMAKSRRKEKSLMEYEVEEGRQFRPRHKLPHLAQEYRENQNMDVAFELSRSLRTRHRDAVLPLNPVQLQDLQARRIS